MTSFPLVSSLPRQNTTVATLTPSPARPARPSRWRSLEHGTFNCVTAAPASDQTITAFVTTAVFAWAVIVALFWWRRSA